MRHYQKVTTDHYAVATVFLQMRFNETPLSIGTGFTWKNEDQHFLITNWHNLSGRNPSSGKHISNTAAEPNNILVHWNKKNSLGLRVVTQLPLLDDEDTPLWWVHPRYKSSVDVALLPLPHIAHAEMYPINEMESDELLVQVGHEVFVLGYPYGLSQAGFPIWKRGSIASEPHIVTDEQPYILIDTASRQGMSGSPVLRRSWGLHFFEKDGFSMGDKYKTLFLGVYSGRLQTKDPLDAQLGMMWPAFYVDEIIAGHARDTKTG